MSESTRMEVALRGADAANRLARWLYARDATSGYIRSGWDTETEDYRDLYRAEAREAFAVAEGRGAA